MTKTWINVGGVWKEASSVWQNVGGVWQKDVVPKGNIGGVWKIFKSYTPTPPAQETGIVTDGLIAYYNSKQGVVNNTWSNLSPTSAGKYNATIEGATVQANGMYFASHNVNLPVLPILKQKTNQTMEIRINTSKSDGQIFLESSSKVQLYTNLYEDSPTDFYFEIMVFDFYTTFSRYTNSSTSALNIDLFLTVVYDYTVNNVSLYINGVLNATKAMPTDNFILGSSDTTFTMGSNDTWYGTMGTVDNLRFYDRALTAEEIQRNYAVGAEVGLPEPAIVLDGLVGYWHYSLGVGDTTWIDIAPESSGQYECTHSNGMLEEDGLYGGNPNVNNIGPRDVTNQDFTIQTIFVPIGYGTINLVLYVDGYGDGAGLEIAVGADNGGSYLVIEGANYYFEQNTIYLTITYNNLTDQLKYIMPNGDEFLASTNILGVNNIVHNISGYTKAIRRYNRILSSEEISQNYRVGSSIGGDIGLPVKFIDSFDYVDIPSLQAMYAYYGATEFAPSLTQGSGALKVTTTSEFGGGMSLTLKPTAITNGLTDGVEFGKSYSIDFMFLTNLQVFATLLLYIDDNNYLGITYDGKDFTITESIDGEITELGSLMNLTLATSVIYSIDFTIDDIVTVTLKQGDTTIANISGMLSSLNRTSTIYKMDFLPTTTDSKTFFGGSTILDNFREI